MGYIVPLILVAGLVYGLYRLLRRWAVRCGNATVLFAWQLFVLTGLFVLFLGGLLLCWLFGRWWLELRVPLWGFYGLYAVTWLVVTWAVCLWRVYGCEDVAASREAGWGAYLALVFGAALCGFVGLVLWQVVPRPLTEGRLSPTIRFEVYAVRYGWDGANAFEYRVYRSPAWFGAIHRKVASGILTAGMPHSCELRGGLPQEFRQGSVQFRMGKTSQSVFLTCTDYSYTQMRMNSETVEVPLQ